MLPGFVSVSRSCRADCDLTSLDDLSPDCVLPPSRPTNCVFFSAPQGSDRLWAELCYHVTQVQVNKGFLFTELRVFLSFLKVFYGFVSEAGVTGSAVAGHAGCCQISRRCLVALFHALREQTPPSQEGPTLRERPRALAPSLPAHPWSRRPMSRSALGAAGLRALRPLHPVLRVPGQVHMDFQKQSFESALEFLGSEPPKGSAQVCVSEFRAFRAPAREVRTSSAHRAFNRPSTHAATAVGASAASAASARRRRSRCWRS